MAERMQTTVSVTVTYMTEMLETHARRVNGKMPDRLFKTDRPQMIKTSIEYWGRLAVKMNATGIRFDLDFMQIAMRLFVLMAEKEDGWYWPDLNQWNRTLDPVIKRYLNVQSLTEKELWNIIRQTRTTSPSATASQCTPDI